MHLSLCIPHLLEFVIPEDFWEIFLTHKAAAENHEHIFITTATGKFLGSYDTFAPEEKHN